MCKNLYSYSMSLTVISSLDNDDNDNDYKNNDSNDDYYNNYNHRGIFLSCGFSCFTVWFLSLLHFACSGGLSRGGCCSGRGGDGHVPCYVILHSDWWSCKIVKASVWNSKRYVGLELSEHPKRNQLCLWKLRNGTHKTRICNKTPASNKSQFLFDSFLPFCLQCCDVLTITAKHRQINYGIQELILLLNLVEISGILVCREIPDDLI